MIKTEDDGLQQAWEKFCDNLKAAGAKALKPQNPQTPLHRADAYRFLTQNLGQAFDLALETKNTAYPALHFFNTPTRKLGGDCADFIYLQAWIDGHHTYRISGQRGTAPFLNFTVQGPRPEKTPGGFAPLHEPFGDIPEANLFGHQLVTNEDGSFELFIGGEPRPQNWLPTTAATRKLFIRQGFNDWSEIPARLSIERLGMAQPKPLPGPAEMITAIGWAGDFLTGVMQDWPDWMFAHGGVDEHNPNNFPPEADTADDKKRGRAATNMHWQIAEDEALIVEFPQHEGLWMLTNMGVFCNSMDYLYRPVSYTPSRTAVDEDGMIRMVLAHDDPGFHNWIDTQGFIRGNLTYRHMLAGTPAHLATRLVKRAHLADILPSRSLRVTNLERSEQLQARFNGIKRRYSL